MQSYVKELKILMEDYLLIRMHLFEIGWHLGLLEQKSTEN